MILITGSSGLIGRHLHAALAGAGWGVRPFDNRRSPGEDVCDRDAVERALEGVARVVHLAAVSRVVDGERAPEQCRRTNVGGLENVLNTALSRTSKPWALFVSSREVYGTAACSPTSEDAEQHPLNTYAHTKVAGERLVNAAREAGLVANICRLSTVYGDTADYRTRVLPAFCRAGAGGGLICVDGKDVVLDPTHIDDVTGGLLALVRETASQQNLPPIHFVSGQGYSLMQLAHLAAAVGEAATQIIVKPQRTYDSTRFVGDPTRARSLLGWMARTRTEDGIGRFVHAYRSLGAREASGATAVQAEQLIKRMV
jgi:nucleoside-diphosphate-sugar epimerase